jgi:hypothetical protein
LSARNPTFRDLKLKARQIFYDTNKIQQEWAQAEREAKGSSKETESETESEIS